jgi:uncharacterized protein YegP (UPF0339 family)
MTGSRPKCEYSFHIRQNKRPYWWVCLAANGQTKFHSENYLGRGTCLNSIKQLTKNLNTLWRIYDPSGNLIKSN